MPTQDLPTPLLLATRLLSGLSLPHHLGHAGPDKSTGLLKEAGPNSILADAKAVPVGLGSEAVTERNQNIESDEGEFIQFGSLLQRYRIYNLSRTLGDDV